MYMDDDIFTVNGVVNIMDMKGATMSHFTQMTPLMMKKMVVAGQVNEITSNIYSATILSMSLAIFVFLLSSHFYENNNEVHSVI